MPTPEFRFLGPAHVAAMALAVIVPAALAFVVRHRPSRRRTQIVCRAFALLLVCNELVSSIYHITLLGFESWLASGLPLHVCGAGVWLAACVLERRGQWAYEVAYFWGTAGTVQALITPELVAGPPSYDFVRFFIVHSGLVAAVLFATWGLGMRPRPGAAWRAFLVTNVFALIVGVLNWAFGWNYMFLCAKPGGVAAQSPFLALPWPWYLLVLELAALLMFQCVYLPFALADRRRVRRGAVAGSAWP